MSAQVKNGNGMLTRAFSLRSKTADKKTLSFDGVIASEEPALMWDWERGEVDEVLLMNGVKYPDKVPLLNAHNRYSVENVIGGTANFNVEGTELVAANSLYDNDLGRDTFGKVEAGFITDFSVGYNVNVATYIDPGESAEINGRTFTASEGRVLKVAKMWTLKEVSLVPIGADATAKVRAEDNISKTVVEDVKPPEKSDTERKDKMEEPKKTEEQKEVQTVAPIVDPVDLDAVRAEGAKAERERVEGIRTAGADLDIAPEVVETAIKENKSVDEARKDILDAFRKSKDEPVVPAIHSHEDESNNRDVIEAALMVRGGMDDEAVKVYGEKTVDASRKISQISMRGLMRWGLEQSGEAMSSFTSDNDMIRKSLELYQRGGAFSTMSLPSLLGNIANKSMLKGYNELPETWADWVDEQTVSDFKTATMVRPTIGSGLTKLGAGGEIKHGSVDEEAETGRAYTWAEMLSITREQIVNDDLNAFTNIPRGLGRDARIKVGDEVYTSLLANGTLSDGYTLCGTDHLNYISGADSAMSTAKAVDAISSALVKFMQMKDKGGKRIGIRPSMLLLPPELEAVAAAVFNSEFVVGPNATKSPNSNIHRGRYEVVTEARLSDSAFHASASATAWYMLAPRTMADSIAVLWLNGVKTPIIERGTVDFSTLGVKFRVYEDFGVMYGGFRGITMSAGA